MTHYIDWYDEHNMYATEQDIYCPLCLDCQIKVVRDRVSICTCRYCLGQQRLWAKEAYDASPEGIAEAEEKRKIAAAEAEEKRKIAAAAAEKKRKDREAELLGMRDQRNDELKQHAPCRYSHKKDKGKGKGKGKDKRKKRR